MAPTTYVTMTRTDPFSVETIVNKANDNLRHLTPILLLKLSMPIVRACSTKAVISISSSEVSGSLMARFWISMNSSQMLRDTDRRKIHSYNGKTILVAVREFCGNVSGNGLIHVLADWERARGGNQR